jgi:predicted RNA-binding Zn ribbon-like protein
MSGQKSQTDPSPKPFELIGGNVALDLVNTLGSRLRESGPEELLTSYDDLLRFAVQTELLSASQAKKLARLDAPHAERTQILNQVRELREALASVAFAQLEEKEPSEADLAILEGYFKQASSHRILAVEDLHLTWSWRGLGRQIAAPLWLLAQAASDLMVSERIALLRCCAKDTCGWLFLDTSKNHTRRWCDMKVCGNRMKARRFQARQAAES